MKKILLSLAFVIVSISTVSGNENDWKFENWDAEGIEKVKFRDYPQISTHTEKENRWLNVQFPSVEFLDITLLPNGKGQVLTFDVRNIDTKKEVKVVFPNGTKEIFTLFECLEKNPEGGNYCINKDVQTTLIKHFKNQPNGSLTFTDITGEITAIPFTLEGFNQAYAALQKRQSKHVEPWTVSEFNGRPIISTVTDDPLFMEIAYGDELSLAFTFDTGISPERITIAFANGSKEDVSLNLCNDDIMHPAGCSCHPNYCADAKVTEKLITYFKSQPQGTLTFVDEGKEISMSFTLEGFNKAFEILEKAYKQAKKQ